ncbi:MAG: ParB/RepB/Spo0J family partition protein [Candidatus Paceibacterota bacterium]
MGLESLIPNKNNQQPQNMGGFVRPQGDEIDEIDIEETHYTIRRERDDLGVLSSLLAGTSHPSRESSPFQQTQSPYAAPQYPTYNEQQTTQPTPRAYQEPPVRESYREPESFNQPVREEWHESQKNSYSSQPVVTQTLPARESFTAPKSKGDHEIPTLSGPIFQVEVGKIQDNPYQPRKEYDVTALDELAASIREFGVMQPLVVTRMNEETEDGLRTTYQLIAGHRRLMASRKVGLKTVPVVIRTNLKRADALEMAIVENIQRQDLNVVETARAYARLSDEFGLTQREIAARLGKSRESVANTLRLLSLPTHIQDAISSGKINESHARILMQIQDPMQQQKIFDQIVHEGLSVRDVKRTLSRATPHAHATHQSANPAMKSLEQDISDVVGAPVHIELSDKGGKIVIHFYSPEEVQGIAQRIRKEQQY